MVDQRENIEYEGHILSLEKIGTKVWITLMPEQKIFYREDFENEKDSKINYAEMFFILAKGEFTLDIPEDGEPVFNYEG